MEGWEEAGEPGWDRTGFPVTAAQEASAALPLTRTRLVSVCPFPYLLFFISLPQENAHRFQNESEFNLVYENL